MKKNKFYSSLVIAVTVVVAALIPLFVSPTVEALDYDTSWGNHATATMKNFVSPFSWCATGNASWSSNPQAISENKWYEAAFMWYHNVSAPVEKGVGGEYGDGKIFCSEKDSAIVSATINAANSAGVSVTTEDFICDKFDSPKYNGGGLLGRGNTNTECGLIFGNKQDDNNFYRDTKSNDEKISYIKKLLGDDVFSPSSLEYYYLVYDTFIPKCTGGKSSGNSGAFVIKELGSNNKLEEVWYTGLNNPEPDSSKKFIYYGDESMTCRQMEKYLHGDDGDAVAALEAYGEYAEKEGIDPSDDGGDGNSDEVEKNCQNQGGAGSLGWIVCSILDWMQRTTTTMYDEVVEPSLKVEKSFFEDTNTFTAWETFRDISNIIFTILILFVIFSQVTGVGIDNYGIKKILPKLIIAAVLVNLSYWICLICVDVSNILGAGFQDFFNGLNSGSQATITYGGEGGGGNVAMDVGIVGVSVAGAAVGIVAIFSNPALLLTLFIAVLGVLISVLFMFVLLAGRKAAIVLLTVFSPIAFVLYLLPNTKKLFDKWLKLWESMLLLYPIAGLLIGGGNFASGLMLSNYKGTADGASVVPIFTAMIVGIIPIFFIPTVLKGAFSAMGAIGGMMAGAGNRLRSGANRALNNNPVSRGLQERGKERENRLKGLRQERRKYRGAARRAGISVDKKTGEIVQRNTPLANLKRNFSKTAVGQAIGVGASMNKDAEDFAKMEAARRSSEYRTTPEAMQATIAGLANKEQAQRVADQETLMKSGRVMFGNKPLNTNSSGEMNSYHADLLKQAHEAHLNGDKAGYDSIMDKVKAAQNIMAKSDDGRGNIQSNYANAITEGNVDGLKDAASHLLDTQGANIKAANRGMHKLIQNLATNDLTSDEAVSKIKSNIDSNAYDAQSINSLTGQSIASADDAALEGILNAVKKGTVSKQEDLTQLQNLIQEARNSNTIQVKGKTNETFDQILNAINGRSTPDFNGGPTTSSGGSFNLS